MHDEKLYEKVKRNKKKLIIILILLFSIFLNVTFFILPSMAFHINMRIRLINENTSNIIVILGVGAYILFIYKHLKLFIGINKYKKSVSENQLDVNLEKHYIKFISGNYFKNVFYILLVIIYSYIFIFKII